MDRYSCATRRVFSVAQRDVTSHLSKPYKAGPLKRANKAIARNLR